MNAPNCSIPPLALILFIASSLSPVHTRAAGAAIPPGIQEALNTPVWYLNYRVFVQLSGPGNELIQRTTIGSMKLGLRSQGPSLSVQEAAAHATTEEGMQFFFSNYANWGSGVNIDESKTDEQNEADMKRVLEENAKAHHVYRWQHSHPDNTGGFTRGSASGFGTVAADPLVNLELDAAKRQFKLTFRCLAFRDTESTRKAVTGVDESGIGTIHHQRVAIERPLYPDHMLLDKIEPSLGQRFEGRIPENNGNLSYSSIHTVTEQQRRGTLAIQLVLSPHPPANVELIIEPPDNYERWMPVAGDNEKMAGDRVPIKVTLQKRGGGPPQFKASRFIYNLWNTTHEKGVCLNWPLRPEADPPPDFQFEQQANPEHYIEGEDRQKAVEIPASATPNTGSVVVSCFDYGAYAEFEAIAELENGQFVHGTVPGRPSGDPLKLPDCATNSKIAKAFFTAHGLGQLADDDDNENDPVGDGFKGDGFTLYEEYRGFMHGDEWTALDPKKKDVFVLNNLRSHPEVDAGISVFKAATSLNVHRLLREYQVRADNQINFNYSAGPHLTDQHVIRIQPGITIAEGATFANALHVGPPGKAKLIRMPPDLGAHRGSAYFAVTIAHEMLHCCNVFHHGEGDPIVTWSYRPPNSQFYENGVPIIVKREDGTVIQPAAFFPSGITAGPVQLGIAHGLHSGAESCLMRYTTAIAYRANADPTVRYFTGGEPPEGTGLCNSRNGTGVNGSRSPQSRFSWAALVADGIPGVLKNRGDCEHQIRVSDNDRAPTAPER